MLFFMMVVGLMAAGIGYGFKTDDCRNLYDDLAAQYKTGQHVVVDLKTQAGCKDLKNVLATLESKAKAGVLK